MEFKVDVKVTDGIKMEVKGELEEEVKGEVAFEGEDLRVLNVR